MVATCVWQALRDDERLDGGRGSGKDSPKAMAARICWYLIPASAAITSRQAKA